MPFGKSVRRILVVGDLAAKAVTGDKGSSKVDPPYVITVVEGLRRYFGPSVQVVRLREEELDRAPAEAGRADCVIIAVGNDAHDEGEFLLSPDDELSYADVLSKGYRNMGKPIKRILIKPLMKSAARPFLSKTSKLGGDRQSLSLKPAQIELIKRMGGINPNTVVTLTCGVSVQSLSDTLRQAVGQPEGQVSVRELESLLERSLKGIKDNHLVFLGHEFHYPPAGHLGAYVSDVLVRSTGRAGEYEVIASLVDQVPISSVIVDRGDSTFPEAFFRSLVGTLGRQFLFAELRSPTILHAREAMERPKDLYFRVSEWHRRRRLRRYRRHHVKEWIVHKPCPASRRKAECKCEHVVVVMNSKTVSAAESVIPMARSVPNTVLVGENTQGSNLFGNIIVYCLPHSKIKLQLASSVSLVPGFEEGVGFVPDYWIDSADPVAEVVRWLNSPDTYRFRLRNAVET